MAWQIHKEAKIGICLPHTGTVSTEWAHRTWGPLIYSDQPGWMKYPIFCRGPPIDLARENLVDQAIEKGVDYIFFIDSDIIFETPRDPNEALRQLMMYDQPIMSGIYRAKKSGPNYNPWAMWTFLGKDQGFKDIETWNKKLVEPDAIGLGCCLIKTEVFKNIEKPWFIWEKERTPSEDFFFCLKAKANGYRVIVDTTVRCSHMALMKILPTDTVSYDSSII